MRLSVLLLGVSLGLTWGGARAEVSAAPAAASVAAPSVSLTGPLLLRFLLAEIAVQRGQIGVAASTYHQLAQATRDARIARRATEINLRAQQTPAAIEDARIWLDSAGSPEDRLAARQTLFSLLAASGRVDELAGLLEKFLRETRSTELGAALMRMNPLFAQITDKAVARRLAEQVTTPYLALPEAHFVRSILAYEAKDAEGALAAINQALQIKPDWEQAALVRTQIEAHSPAMLDNLGRFVRANPKAREARLAYARALVGAQRFADALDEFNGLLKENADNPDVVYAVALLSLQLKQPDVAESHLKRLLDMGTGEAGRARLYLGQIAEVRGDAEAALGWYRGVEENAGEMYVSARARILSLLVSRGRADEALASLNEARLPAVERTRLILAGAQLLREKNQFDKALTALEAGLAAEPDQAELLYEAALIDEKLNQPKVAEARLRRLIKIEPGNAHAYNALGYSLADRNERLDEAQRLIEKALELRPGDPFILDSKGWLLFRQGDAQGAIEMLQRALAVKSDPEIAAHYGEVLWATGQRDAAQKAWADAAKAFPDNETLTAVIKRYSPN